MTVPRLRYSRKTERGAKQFPTGLVMRAAPFALLTLTAALVLSACLPAAAQNPGRLTRSLLRSTVKAAITTG